MNVKLAKPERQYLDVLAKKNKKKPEAFAREILEDFLENDALVKLAAERMAAWEADGFRTYSLDEVLKMCKD